MSVTIIATIGDGSAEHAVMARIADAGATVFRFNLAAGRSPAEVIERVQVARSIGAPVDIMLDFPIPGRKVRMSTPDAQELPVAAGDLVEFSDADDWPAHPRQIHLPLGRLGPPLLAGDTLTIGDGELVFEVVESHPDRRHVTARSVSDWFLSNGKGVVVSGRDNITADGYQQRLAGYIEELGWLRPDYCAFSFVEKATQLADIRSVLADCGPSGWRPRIVAKIESAAGMDNLEEIVHMADLVMVARGDLALYCPFDQLGVHQHRIMQVAAVRDTPVIVATHVLESAMRRAVPSRAEIVDLTNTVLNGASGILLSKETSARDNPVYPVEVARRIITAAELVSRR